MADNDTDLERMFMAARQQRFELPDGLSDRMRADANAVQAQLTRPLQQETESRWAQFKNLLGGWPGIGGLATACAAGVWIGVSPPTFIPDPVDLVFQQQDAVDLLDSGSLGEILTEEG